MCKKLTMLFLTLMISLSASSCGFSDSDMDIYEKIHKTYNNMQSYSTDLDLTVFSNKTKNRYFVSQKVKTPDKFYTLVTDPDGIFSVTTITNGETTKTSADSSDYAVTLPSQDYLNILFINNFLGVYYASESTSHNVSSSLIKNDKTVLSVDIPKNNTYFSQVSVSFDNKTLLPDSLTVYGSDNKVLASAKYENFQLNEKIDDSVFDTD